ncbi:MAG: glycosyltransferase family 4 protein [Aeoliella sp.]
MLDDKIIIYLIAGLGACALSLVVTPTVRWASRKFGFVDRPDGRRKTHKQPIALGGGAAVLIAIAGALGLVFVFAHMAGLSLLSGNRIAPLACLAGGSVFIVVLGLLDDVVGLRGRQKLLGQALVVGLLIYVGVKIEGFTAFGQYVDLAWLAIPASAFWLLGTTNAINLIDGIDGLAGSVGLILSLTIAAITGWQGNVLETSIMLALAGAQIGFLRYNFAPATIYLGDAGSMLIGLMCGAIAVMSNAKSSAAMAFAVPIAVWSIPIIDTFAALLRRKLTGRSLFTADRGHMHHSLLVRGWSVRQASLFIALICATTCLSAVLSIYMGNELIALLTVVAVMLFLIFTQTFGHIEFALLRDRVRYLTNSLVRTEAVDVSAVRDSCIQLQGSREWSKLWAAIIEAADGYHLARITMTIDMPAIHESFFGNWESTRIKSADSERIWQVSHPLVLDDELVGQIDLSGEIIAEGNESTLSQIVQALEFLEPIEEDIRQIREHIELDETHMRLARPTDETLSGPPLTEPLVSDTAASLAATAEAPTSELPVGK